MNTPPLLLGAALLFWGWQMDLLWLGGVLGIGLEISRVISSRWEFRQADLDRVWTFCIALYFGVLVYGFASTRDFAPLSGLFANPSPANRIALVQRGARSIFFLFQWMPVAFFGMAFVQAFGVQRTMPWSTFSWWLRRARSRRTRHSAIASEGVNVAYPYLAVCLLAASATNPDKPWFYAGVSGLVAWALWPRRSPAFSTPVWAACLSAVIALGYGGQAGMLALRQALERFDAALLSRFYGATHFDAKESRTRLGSIGERKLSGRIVLRLQASDGNPPALLHEASYSRFKAPIWTASRKEFNAVVSEDDRVTWDLIPGKHSLHTTTIALPLRGGEGILPLPPGSSRLEDLPAFILETNRFGTVRSGGGPGFVQYRVRHDDRNSFGAMPDADDLEVPELERAAVARIARELQLSPDLPKEALSKLATFFADHFKYATYLSATDRAKSDRSALAAFLLERRTGHCEYFASATVLLLRQAGIPARYAVGYSVQEKKGGQYVVRERHAHAWCVAWVDGAWRAVDNTPSSWAAFEAQHASYWEAVSDAWSRLKFEFAKWRWRRTGLGRYLVWVGIPLLLLVAGGRLVFRRQWTRARQHTTEGSAVAEWPGLDSEFYRVERALIAAGWERQAGETLSAWLQRAQTARTIDHDALHSALALHYRLRFDPFGLSDEERSQLRKAVERWLIELKADSGRAEGTSR